ncbi:hypothetical protein GGTG_05614 [Gaeumannomyces tritici R3-111a-1]|uniref:Uncharacterized protein n=1 Tax=Gaeumannomyces tritici (strain R3-111a-1) TaxID=644352 RepID=J3NWF0_GAET3|nr:hypothetical protein GGTG_05614 [Gaeumannomyces tritici R3-111a-1]EJT75682.1 hypothetical protein GGTG_05614 [Gaeumannomyces tritici R3-111a-1]
MASMRVECRVSVIPVSATLDKQSSTPPRHKIPEQLESFERVQTRHSISPTPSRKMNHYQHVNKPLSSPPRQDRANAKRGMMLSISGTLANHMTQHDRQARDPWLVFSISLGDYINLCVHPFLPPVLFFDNRRRRTLSWHGTWIRVAICRPLAALQPRAAL